MNVFEHFACHTRLPISLDDVRQHIIEVNVVSTVRFVPADLNPEIIMGFVRVSKWKPPYGELGVHAEIFYSTKISLEFRRVVQCKELIHLLDNHQETAQSFDEVNQLIAALADQKSN